MPSNDNRQQTNENQPPIDAAYVQRRTGEIATALGDEWTVVESNNPEHHGKLRVKTETGPGEIYVGFERRDRRVTISGAWPQLDGRSMSPRDYGAIKRDEKAPEISVSMDRSSAQIAAEIKRRFLPRYIAILATCHKYVAERDSARATARASAERLAKVAGVSLDRHLDETRTEFTFTVSGSTTLGTGDESWSARVQVDSVCARIELRTSVRDAETVLRLLTAK